MRYSDVWCSRIDYASSLQAVRRTFRWWITKQRERASRRTHVELLPKLTQEVDGRICIKDDPPLITHLDDDQLVQKLSVLVEEYNPSLRIDRQGLLAQYHLVDVPHKVAGIGS